MTTDLQPEIGITETRRNSGSWQLRCANVNRESSANMGQSGKCLLRPVFVRARLLFFFVAGDSFVGCGEFELAFFLKGTKYGLNTLVV